MADAKTDVSPAAAPKAAPAAGPAGGADRTHLLLFVVLAAITLVAPYFVYPVFLMKALCFALFEATSGGLLWTASAHRGAVTGVSVPADTDLLITSGHDGAVRVWSMGLAPELANERVPIRGRWLASAVLGGHERFVAGGTDGALHAWTFAGEQSVDTAPGGWTRSISASAAGDRFVTGGGDRVLVWRGVDLALERTISAGSDLVAP